MTRDASSLARLGQVLIQTADADYIIDVMNKLSHLSRSLIIQTQVVIAYDEIKIAQPRADLEPLLTLTKQMQANINMDSEEADRLIIYTAAIKNEGVLMQIRSAITNVQAVQSLISGCPAE